MKAKWLQNWATSDATSSSSDATLHESSIVASVAAKESKNDGLKKKDDSSNKSRLKFGLKSESPSRETPRADTDQSGEDMGHSHKGDHINKDKEAAVVEYEEGEDRERGFDDKDTKDKKAPPVAGNQWIGPK